MPQLEVLGIAFDSYPSRDEERQNVLHANHDPRGGYDPKQGERDQPNMGGRFRGPVCLA